MVGTAVSLLERLRGELVVSCQAAAGSPLEPTEHIVALARSVVLGGGKALRIEGIRNITAVRPAVDVPIIGIVKATHPQTDVFITATTIEVMALSNVGADIIAFDATLRPRPAPIAELVAAVHQHGRIAMADISTVEEAHAALAAGADFVGTTLSGYTDYSPDIEGPDFKLMSDLRQAGLRFAAEGRIWTPEEARKALDLGAEFVVVGSAITRPDAITRRFAAAVSAHHQSNRQMGDVL